MKKISFSTRMVGDRRLLFFDEMKNLGLLLFLSTSDFFALPMNEDEKAAQLAAIYTHIGIERKNVYAGYQVHSANIVEIDRINPKTAEQEPSKSKFGECMSEGDAVVVQDSLLSEQKAKSITTGGAALPKDSAQITDSKIYGAEFDRTDGLISADKSHCLVTKFADCTPIVIYDPKKNVLCSLHSGWRGTQQKIAARAIELLIKNYSCDVKNLIVFIGPAISAGDFEVGDDLVALFEESYGDISSHLRLKPNGKFLFDMQRLIVDTLIVDGILDDHIFVTELETVRNLMMHSYRRDKENSGRMLLFAMQNNGY